jgi:hypothetical protein
VPHNVLYDTSGTGGVKEPLHHLELIVNAGLSTGGQLLRELPRGANRRNTKAEDQNGHNRTHATGLGSINCPPLMAPAATSKINSSCGSRGLIKPVGVRSLRKSPRPGKLKLVGRPSHKPDPQRAHYYPTPRSPRSQRSQYKTRPSGSYQIVILNVVDLNRGGCR